VVAARAEAPASPASYTGMMCGSSTAAADLAAGQARPPECVLKDKVA